MCHENYSCKQISIIFNIVYFSLLWFKDLSPKWGGGTTKIVSFKVSMKLVSVTDGSHTEGCRAYSGIADLDSSTLSLCLLCTFKE